MCVCVNVRHAPYARTPRVHMKILRHTARTVAMVARVAADDDLGDTFRVVVRESAMWRIWLRARGLAPIVLRLVSVVYRYHMGINLV